jgi:hypothetical protein
VEFVVDKVELGQVSSEYFSFPLPVFIPPISPQSQSPIIWGWYNSLPTAAARVQTRVQSCGICGLQSGAGADFLRVLQSPPANFYSTNFSTITITYHLGLVQ